MYGVKANDDDVSAFGRVAYAELAKCFTLTRSIRQAEDETYLERLQALRRGALSAQDVQYWNERSLHNLRADACWLVGKFGIISCFKP